MWPSELGGSYNPEKFKSTKGIVSRWGFEPMPAPDLPCWRREGSPTGLVCNAMGRFIKVSF